MQDSARLLHSSAMHAGAVGRGGSGGASDRELELIGQQIDAASHRHGPALFLGWSAAAGAAVYAAVARSVPADLALLMDTTLWLGVVSSISLTEAWVKFRAPLLERWVGVDVGRRVFRAQYAVESALAVTAAGLLWAQAGSAAGMLNTLGASPGRLLAGAGAILLLELGVVFPALDLRGRHFIATAARPATLTTEKQAAYVAAVRAGVAGKASPPAQLHLASVLLAFAKAGCLAGYTWALLLQHAAH